MDEPTIKQHIFLSPHLDDAALSCGGSIHTQCQRGQAVQVITVFAGSPTEASPSDYAEELRRRWGGATDPVAERRREDRLAMAHLGASFKHWELCDCVYRLDPATNRALYATEESIFGAVHPLERAWHIELAERLAEEMPVTAARFYAPLSVGHHVDHQIVHRAARRLFEQGFPVLFYEDFPYAGDQQAVEQALTQCGAGAWQMRVVHLCIADLDAKCRSIAAYRSQISTFWQDDDEMRQFVREQTQNAKGRLAERYWQLSDPC